MDLNIYGSHDVDICLFGCLQYFFAGHWLPVLLPPAVTVNTGMLSYLLHCVSLCWLFVLLLHLLLSSSQCCLFTAVRTVPSSNCSAVFTANGCKPSPVLTFFTQLPKTDSRARERDGEVAWGNFFQAAPIGEVSWFSVLSGSVLQDISPHGWPAHISGIFELNCATLGLFECLPLDKGCQTSANSAWFVPIDPKPPIP